MGHYNTLKLRQRKERSTYPENLNLRIHRALSWLRRAEQENDADSRFIFLWIAFNAAYATEINDQKNPGEQKTFNAFLEKLHSLDTKKRLDELVWQAYPNAIRMLLNNRYTFPDFWEYQKGNITEAQWTDRFIKSKKFSNSFLAKQDTPAVLAIVLNRIYTLRNQLIHGGATWSGNVNRDQIRDCVHIMDILSPTVIEIMMDSPNTLWGNAAYPVVKED